MIILKTEAEMDAMQPAGRLAGRILEQLGEMIQPGVTLKELDRRAAGMIRSAGAEPTYLGYRQSPEQPPFPGVITASLNDEVCHGFPDKRRLRDGDIICVDIGLRLNGWCGDTCRTWGVGKISPAAQQLVEVTRQCLEAGIAAARPGGRTGDIGAAIQQIAEAHNFGIVREFGGHGIGKYPHESPFVAHYGKPGLGTELRPGLVFTIEPMLNAGTARIKMRPDGWTALTADGSLSAQFEHQLAVRTDRIEVLTAVE
jgi:methionyl aminopeptidase